ncbi:MAG: hypothetical protein ACJ8H8_07735 [Geminicoccaceae bacterium]
MLQNVEVSKSGYVPIFIRRATPALGPPVGDAEPAAVDALPRSGSTVMLARVRS